MNLCLKLEHYLAKSEKWLSIEIAYFILLLIIIPLSIPPLSILYYFTCFLYLLCLQK